MFSHYNWLFLLAVTVISWFIAILLTIIIHRLPILLAHNWRHDCLAYLNQQNSALLYPTKLFDWHSHCPDCQAVLSWRMLIPLISFLMLDRNCHFCHRPISWRYPTIELLSIASALAVAIKFGSSNQALAGILLSWFLIVATFIDLEHQILPDGLTLSLLWLGLLCNTQQLFTKPTDAIIGAVSGYLFLWGIAKLFKLIRKVDGMGHGDFKLFAALGGWFGWQQLPTLLLIASCLGTLLGFLLIAGKKINFNKQLPFGPYLAFAGWCALFWPYRF